MANELFILGMNGKVYFGEPADLLAALTEMSNVKDVTVSMEAGEADVTTRANSGWWATASTLKEASMEFEMQWKPSDAGFAAVQEAFMNSSQIRMIAMSQARDVVGSEGLLGDWSITQFSRNEPLEEAQTVSVTAKLALFDSWVKVAA